MPQTVSEEAVRQKWLRRMVQELGFPKGLVAVEKGFSSQGRRFDILCYANVGGALVPLLLVECKAVPLTQEAFQQALGYNETIRSPFICLANQTEISTYWQQQGAWASVPFLPSYAQLVERLCFLSKP